MKNKIINVLKKIKGCWIPDELCSKDDLIIMAYQFVGACVLGTFCVLNKL